MHPSIEASLADLQCPPPIPALLPVAWQRRDFLQQIKKFSLRPSGPTSTDMNRADKIVKTPERDGIEPPRGAMDRSGDAARGSNAP
ncbi:hypothetical protein OV079_33875 [Nannocystis pusilla]|uniref:Uncharacterized protein n=1 Tax=Nannocystis pusilla TaxID=889268 RepID=A0A9X3EUU9_9BACT|nr:hypothetical protein [Nannocystis pusilla]MCY1010471.1 hypothetical protein [Nannocystis pusilla]